MPDAKSSPVALPATPVQPAPAIGSLLACFVRIRLSHVRNVTDALSLAPGACMQAYRSIPLKTLRASSALLRGAFLLLVFRPGLSGQCRVEAPACLSFLAAGKNRPGR
jgi:hypothetical protein